MLTSDELRALYERYGYLLHRRCAAILGNPQDAADALQEVFVRLQHSKGPRDTASMLPWLYSIASNCCFDQLRRRSPQVGLDSLPEAAGAGDAADGDRRALVGAILRQLDDRTRSVGVMHFLGGFTQEEVAQRLGLSRRTVGKRVKRFEEQVRDRWRAAGGE